MRILAAPSLSSLTTLRLGGTALAEVAVESLDDFAALDGELAHLGGKPMVLGGGSNILAEDGETPFVLVRPQWGQGREPEIRSGSETGPQEIRIRVGAGLRLPALLAWCAARGFSGLEGLVGVPGRLGGAVAMNAGAYGCETGSLLRGLTLYVPGKGLVALAPGQWETAYRRFAPTWESIPGLDGMTEAPAWFIVAEAELGLTVAEPETVRRAMSACLARKKSTQPVTAHTAGCVFKNPSGPSGLAGALSAGMLLEQAGMRGKGMGGMRFTEKHANFLANEGGGTFAAAMELIDEASRAVARKTGINLQLEIKVWSCR